MSLLDLLDDEEAWCEFLAYREQSGNMSPKRLADLQAFVEGREYCPVVNSIRTGAPFAIPAKKLVSKGNSPKKRVIYVFPRAQNYVLKLLTYLVIRRYDHLFAPNLYSFRAHTNAKAAVQTLVARRGIDGMRSYKVDVSDYFGSVDVELLLPKLRAALHDDAELYSFLEGMLCNSEALCDGNIVRERKGIMAGSPISSFLANLYLADLDWRFAGLPYPYARYSDDIIVFAPSAEEVAHCEELVKQELAALRLRVNPAKEARTAPHEEWTFLGFSYCDGVVDISDVSLSKMKAKMRRKSRALLRWRARKGIDHEYAVKAFIRVFNQRLLDESQGNDLSWSRWFNPLITTDASLKELDAYMQDCIRYIATEKRTKARFDFRYEDMKRLGYRSLVHEYHCLRKEREDD